MHYKKWFVESGSITNISTLWFNRLIVLLAFIFPFKEIYGKDIIILAFLFWIFQIDKEALKNIFKEKTIIYFSGLIFLLLISLLYTEDNISYGRGYLERFLIYIYFPMIMIATSIKKEYIKFVISAFVVSMFLNELISYGILFDFWLEMKGGFPVYFMHHVAYSILISFVVMLLIYSFLHEGNKIKKTIYLFFILTMIGNLVFSGGRTGQVTLFLTFMMTMLIYFKTSTKLLLGVFLAPLVIIFISYQNFEQFQERADLAITETQKVLNEGNFNSSFGTRLAGFVVTKDILKESSTFEILLGHGFGDLNLNIHKAINTYNPARLAFMINNNQMHGFYLDVLVSLGLFGLIFFIMFLYSILKIKLEDGLLGYLKIALVATIAVSALPDNPVATQYTMFMISIFVGLMLAQNRIEKQERAV